MPRACAPSYFSLENNNKTPRADAATRASYGDLEACVDLILRLMHRDSPSGSQEKDLCSVCVPTNRTVSVSVMFKEHSVLEQVR